MNKTALFILITFSALVTSYGQQVTKNVKKVTTFKGAQINTEKVDKFIESQMNSLNMPGVSVAIINEGKIVYHRALGVSNADTKEKINNESIFEAASLSKPVFAYFVMKMAEKGVIDLDRPLYFYLPDESMERDQRYKSVTAKMVLCHTTGFPNWRWFDKLPEEKGLERGDFYIKQDPGSGFTYSGEAYQYLARVLAHLNFMNLNELEGLFRKEVAIPLEMNHAYFVWDDFLYKHKVFGHNDGKVRERSWGSGLPHQNSRMMGAAGGLHTEAVNYARFLISIMEERGLYKSSFATMLQPCVELPKDDSNYIENGITDWSHGFGIRRIGSDTVFLHGGSNSDFQSEFAFSKSKNLGYVFFTNSDKGKEFNQNLKTLLELSDSK